MISGMWGKKIGMTQFFVEDKVIPVTAIDISHWVIVGLKTQERDGYNAIQIGCKRNSYKSEVYKPEWLKNLKKYFSFVREVQVDQLSDAMQIGQAPDFISFFNKGDKISITGKTRGKGFAGVVKRHDFNGPPGSHGSTMGKRTGTLSFMRRQGRVIKGKRMPGHMGTVNRMMKNLPVIDIEKNVLFVKGSVPGHSGSLIYIQKI